MAAAPVHEQHTQLGCQIGVHIPQSILNNVPLLGIAVQTGSKPTCCLWLVREGALAPKPSRDNRFLYLFFKTNGGQLRWAYDNRLAVTASSCGSWRSASLLTREACATSPRRWGLACDHEGCAVLCRMSMKMDVPSPHPLASLRLAAPAPSLPPSVPPCSVQ